MNLATSNAQVEAAASLLRAIANKNRLIILCELLRGELSVAELRKSVDLRQSALSQHLAKLRADKLVTTRRQSQSVLYTLASDNVRALIELLNRLHCAPHGASMDA